MPVTGVALAIGLALIPGYAYLRWTRPARYPEEESQLSEALNVLTMGLATTGFVLAFFGALFPRSALRVLAISQEPLNQWAANDLRSLVGATLAVGLTSVGLAGVSACIGVRFRTKRYSQTALQEALIDVPSEKVRAITLNLKNGKTVKGLLHAYSLTDDKAQFAIALNAPLVFHLEGSEPVTHDSGRVVFFGSDIECIVVKHKPK